MANYCPDCYDNDELVVMEKEEKIEGLKRPTKEQKQLSLIEVETSWQQEWWGMPNFSNEDIRPDSKITVNFVTSQDRKEFIDRLGVGKITGQADTMWFPPQERLKNCEYFYDGEPTDSRYPVCIPSKGRYDIQTTGKVLDSMGVSYHFFVEETEGDLYKKALGENKVVVMPFHDLGQGGIPARNYIWEYCKEREYKRHWTVDDNITEFRRTHLTRRLKVKGGAFFRAMEDFVDRYENIAMAGPHHLGFVKVVERIDE